MTWTYLGIMAHKGWGGALLVNYAGGYTRALVDYRHSEPVRIVEIFEP